MLALRSLALVLLLALPAVAADVVFPTGSRLGLVPPPGMTPSRAFVGFEDRDERVALVLVALPGQAFADIDKSAAPELLKKQGMNVDMREDFAHPLGKAILVTGRQQIDGVALQKWIMVIAAGDITALITVQIPDTALSRYPAATIRAALASIVVRPTVPPEEQLSLLPFQVNELAGFKIGGIIAGRALMLTDGEPGSVGTSPEVHTHMIVAVAPGGPASAAERANFARDVFSSIPNLKEVRLELSEPLRIAGQPGYQIIGRGKEATGGQDITVVQWIRFGGSGYLHFVGVARSEAWTPAYGRFRKVRDGIEPR